MDIVINILCGVAGIAGTLAVLTPVILSLLVAVEKLTPEGTAIDTTLDRLIAVFSFIGRFATVGNATKVRELADGLKARQNQVE